ncbi:MAG: PilZ domain-containing protein [Planctomycetota bacterium]|jgi:c-di-GMP-binding flagellar brake protein YcgR
MENQGQSAPSERAGTAERRRHVRFLDEVKVRYRDIEGTDPSQWGRSRDLSLGGLALITERPVPVGCHLALEIHISTEPAPVLALARVVRCAQQDADGATAGVEFLWMSAEDRGNLERLADYFRKKYGTTGDLQSPGSA